MDEAAWGAVLVLGARALELECAKAKRSGKGMEEAGGGFGFAFGCCVDSTVWWLEASSISALDIFQLEP